ncbi:MAG TPA: DUF4097 family beta strand repeat-containing protein [Clostridia bacterium]|nr:DUF4097 family beta strand repeat-containing protein [Clostridia bacterium]
MNRREFMNRLESCLTCIDRSEREAALRYYEEYFDDAGPEKEAEVISSLGSPEALAREVIAQTGEQTKKEATGSYNERNPSEFHSIKADVINANISVVRGQEWRIDIIYPEERIKPIVSIVNGVLQVTEEHHKFGRLFQIGGWRPGRIDITVPDVKFRSFEIEGVNGAILVQDITLSSVKCETVNGSVEISRVFADTIHGESVNGGVAITSCQAKNRCKGETVNGGVTLEGELRGDISAEAVNGTLRISTGLPIKEYDIDVENISGSVRINGEKHRKEVHIVHGAANRIKVEAVNGSISLDFGI